jgi:hypothetical protein
MLKFSKIIEETESARKDADGALGKAAFEKAVAAWVSKS